MQLATLLSCGSVLRGVKLPPISEPLRWRCGRPWIWWIFSPSPKHNLLYSIVFRVVTGCTFVCVQVEVDSTRALLPTEVKLWAKWAGSHRCHKKNRRCGLNPSIVSRHECARIDGHSTLTPSKLLHYTATARRALGSSTRVVQNCRTLHYCCCRIGRSDPCTHKTQLTQNALPVASCSSAAPVSAPASLACRQRPRRAVVKLA